MTSIANGLRSSAEIRHELDRAVWTQPITDLHTHCYTPRFGASPQPGGLLLWGIDELVTYHYLVAEVYRIVPAAELPYDTFWQWTKQQQADHIWKHLFAGRTPISEACRGVITTLSRLGLDPHEKTLTPYRKWFAQQNANDYIDKVMSLSSVDQITMTNPVFDDHERAMWDRDAGVGVDPRFKAVLRIDPLLRAWPTAAAKLAQWGYKVSPNIDATTAAEVRRFLGHWIDRMKAIYVAVSLPPTFRFPAGDNCDEVLAQAVLPVLAERRMPFAMMIGSNTQVNPPLKDAGDMCGKADILAVVNLCRQFPQNKFLVTMLSRENQHELCVTARKFGNLMIFGCWWFLNNPSIIEEMTRMRLELLGTTFIPQHSDARVLDQLIYKWDHSRRLIAKVLADKYSDLAEAGYTVTPQQIRQDVALLLRENFHSFLKR